MCCPYVHYTVHKVNTSVVYLCLADSSPFYTNSTLLLPNYETLSVQDSGAKNWIIHMNSIYQTSAFVGASSFSFLVSLQIGSAEGS